MNRAIAVVHPADPHDRRRGGRGVHGAGARATRAHLRTVLVTAHGAVDCSPGGSATAAVMAVLDAMGLLGDAASFTHEGLSGAAHGPASRRGRRSANGRRSSWRWTAEAWPTGEQTWILDHDDPFHQGAAHGGGGGVGRGC